MLSLIENKLKTESSEYGAKRSSTHLSHKKSLPTFNIPMSILQVSVIRGFP